MNHLEVAIAGMLFLCISFVGLSIHDRLNRQGIACTQLSKVASHAR